MSQALSQAPSHATPHAGSPAGFPQADPSRFKPLAATDLVLAYLASQKTAPDTAKLAKALRALIATDQVAATTTALVADGRVNLVTPPTKGKSKAGKAKVELTETGRQAAATLLGRDTGATWSQLLLRRFLPLILGLDPEAGEVRTRLARPEGQQNALIAIAFGLPAEVAGRKAAVQSELVWRTLKAGLGAVVGSGRFPEIPKPGVTERVILAGLAGLQTTPKVPTAAAIMKALTGAAVGLKEASTSAAVAHAIAHALGQRGEAERPEPPPPSLSPSGDAAGFAARVQAVAEALTTPPFQGRVAIAQVYDAYGRVHPDAGSLQSFKERLVAAAFKQLLQLGRLDLPERMDRDLRLRSEAPWGRDLVHFVITDRR